MKTLNLAVNLKKYRENLNISQKEISKQLGIAANTYSSYETGRREPSLTILINLSAILKCSIEDILLDHSIPFNNNFSDNKLSLLEDIDLNKFTKNNILNQLSVTKKYYENSLSELNERIPKKINEINKLITFIKESIDDNPINFDVSNTAVKPVSSSTDVSDFIGASLESSSNDDKFKCLGKQMKSLSTEVGMIDVWVAGKVSCGIPTPPYTDIQEHMELPMITPIVAGKEYFVLHASGDSMNKLISDGEKMVIEKTQIIEDGDIAVFLINGECTLKEYVSDCDSACTLKPLSTNPIHEDQYYESTVDLLIQGKYLCKVKDLLKQYDEIMKR